MERDLLIKSDLHLHTTFSDGEMSPDEVIEMAASLGYTQAAVTDHDSIKGVGEALAAGVKYGVEVVPGIEITLRFVRENFVGSLHLLMYFSRELYHSALFRSQLDDIVSRGRGEELVRVRVSRINEEFGPAGKNPVLSSPLSASSVLDAAANVSRRHFAQVLASEHGLSRDQISLLIGNSSPAYVPSGVDMALLRPLFASYPVVPVLAHPAAGSFPGDSHYKEVLPSFDVVTALLPEFLLLGVLGLEVYYPGHTPAHIEALLTIASEHGLLVTGGSDCHDTVERPMGTGGLAHPVDFSPWFIL